MEQVTQELKTGEAVGGTVLATRDVKPGWKTSEFIVALLPWVIIGGILVLVGIGRAELADVWQIIGALGLGGGYAAGRYSEARAAVKAG